MKNFWISILIISGCYQKNPKNESYRLNENLFFPGQQISFITDSLVREASGLEFSTLNNGMLWTHNDSGDGPRLFLLDTSGVIRMQVHLNGIKSIDWEDITLASPYIYIADIGDNNARRNHLFIHRIAEPLFESKAEVEIEVKDISTMKFTYENGPRDAETLLYDYNSDELIIVTKREKNCLVYPFHFQSSSELVQLRAAGSIPLRHFTSGDANEQGEVLIKNYDAVFYWGPSDELIVRRLINGPEFTIPYKTEPQGEAICWDQKGGFYTVSEFNEYSKQYIYYYERMK